MNPDRILEVCLGATSVGFICSSDEVLPCVLPDQQRGTNVHVEGTDDPLLRDLHAHVQHLEQIGRNTFPFIAMKKKQTKNILCKRFCLIKQGFCLSFEKKSPI